MSATPKPVSFRAYLLPDGWRWEGDLRHTGNAAFPWELTASGPPLGRHRRPAVIGAGRTQEEAIRATVDAANRKAAGQ